MLKMESIKKKHYLAAALVIATASASFAASSRTPTPSATMGTLAVTGGLIPGTCSVSLGRGGKADFGTMSADSLNSVSRFGTVLNTSPAIPLTVSCTIPTQIGIRILDNRAASLKSITNGDNVTLQFGSKVDTCASSCASDRAYGLGLASNNNSVGLYVIDADTFATDGASGVAAVLKSNGEIDYAKSVQTFNSSPRGWYTWMASLSSKAPTMGKVFTANIYVTPTINSISSLPMNASVSLDGNATVIIYYI
jgi:type 1 fimbria pilin